MKTKEFISKMNDMTGVEIDLSNTGISIYNLDRELVGWVSINDFGLVASFKELDDMDNKNEIVKLIFEYALTPLSEREDESRFYVTMIPGNTNWDAYLNLSKYDNHLFLDDNRISDNIQTIFTKSEYNELQQRYSEWLPKFDEKDPHFEFLEEK